MIKNWPENLIDLKQALEPFELRIICGVYFLMSDDAVVYIGASIDVHSRIKIHYKNIAPITKVHVLPVENIRTALKLEKELIIHFKPIFNKTDNPDARIPVNGKPSYPKQYKSMVHYLLSESTIESIDKILATLTGIEEHVIKCRYNIGATFRTLNELGGLFGLTRERIRQIQKKAERKLAHPTRLKRFVKR